MGDQELLQEPKFVFQNTLESPPEDFDIDSPDFSVHHLHSSPLSAAAATTSHHPHSPCSSCGCSDHSRKRPSVIGPTAHHPNPAKKLFLDTPPAVHHHHQSAAACSLPLRRTVSDSWAASGSGVLSNTPPAAENLSVTPPSASNSCRPPRPPTLRRSLSNPISSPLPLQRTSSSSAEDLNHNNTPSSKLSKMWSSWREFKRYMEEEFLGVEQQTEDRHCEEIPSLTVVPDTENENDNGNGFVNTDIPDTENNNDNGNGFLNTDKDDSATKFDELLSVERVGERLHIHFKCPCGNVYQFLTVDGNCFYKLM